MFAHTVEADVADEHQLVVFFLEHALQVAGGVGVQASKQLGVHPGDASGSVFQAGALGILADGQQDLTHGRLNAGQIHVLHAGWGNNISRAVDEKIGVGGRRGRHWGDFVVA